MYKLGIGDTHGHCLVSTATWVKTGPRMTFMNFMVLFYYELQKKKKKMMMILCLQEK